MNEVREEKSPSVRRSVRYSVARSTRSKSMSVMSDAEWETLFQNRRDIKKSIANPDYHRYVLSSEDISEEGEIEEVEEEDYRVDAGDIDLILANRRKKTKSKIKEFFYPVCPPVPPQSVVPEEVTDPDPEAEESEILYNLRAFYLDELDMEKMPRKEKLFVYDPVERKIVGKLTLCTEVFDDKILFTSEGIKTNEDLESKDVYFHFAWITNDFVPIKEFRSEQTWAPGEDRFRSLHITRFGDAGFHISGKRGCDGDEINEAYFAKMKSLKRVLTEASIFILMRKLISTYFVGTLKMRCVFPTGDICSTNIRVFRPERIVFNGVSLFAVRIRRKVRPPNGPEEITNSYFTTSGQYIAQVFKGERFRIQIDPGAILNTDGIVEPERIVPLRHRFQDDPQVYSFYLDEMNRCSYKDRLYLEDHPEVMQIISQLMKEFLMNKPHRVVAFAQNYFTRLL